MTNKFDEFLWKEIFVVGPDEDSSWPQNLEMCCSFEELVEHMRSLSPSTDTDIRILNGYLTPADILPSSLKNKKAYIIVCAVNQLEDAATIIEAASADEQEQVVDLAREVEEIVNGTTTAFATDIDNIFILYGYEINVTLAPNDEDMDEEILETCKDISKEVEDIRARSTIRRKHDQQSKKEESKSQPV